MRKWVTYRDLSLKKSQKKVSYFYVIFEVLEMVWQYFDPKPFRYVCKKNGGGKKYSQKVLLLDKKTAVSG